MGRIFVILFVLFILSSPLVVAQQLPSKTIHFIDAETGNALRGMTVHLALSFDESKPIERAFYMKEDGLRIPVSTGTYSVQAILDDQRTNTSDYFFSGTLEMEGEGISINVFPIGQVNGNVYDRLNNLVSSVDLQVTCDKITSIIFPEKTDKYGSFFTYVPTGACIIEATDNTYLGKKVVNVRKGESYQPDIILDTKIASKNTKAWVIGSLIALLVLAALLKRYVRLPKKKPKPQQNSKMTSILKTLNEREKAIMEYVIAHPNATSSAMRHDLKVPRTSIARILEHLAKKNVVELERVGKMKKVKLAEWLNKK